jgi:cytidylate kinase
MIIAIDGPAAAGKSTVARAVAGGLGLTFLDTGAMYRAVTLEVLERGVDPHAEEACARVARSMRLSFDGDEIRIDGRRGEPAIRGEAVTRAVSVVSAHPGVRAAMVPLQRIEAHRRGGVVAEGRDMASVVFPDADFKFYLDASAEERARRRASELGDPRRYEQILEDIRRRDHLDSTRKDSPLVKVPGAIVIETDGLEAVDAARLILERIRAGRVAR